MSGNPGTAEAGRSAPERALDPERLRADLATLQAVAAAIARAGSAQEICVDVLEAVVRSAPLHLQPRGRIEVDQGGRLVELHALGAHAEAAADDGHVCVPLLRGTDRRVGALTVWPAPGTTAARDPQGRQLLTTIAAQLAVGIEGALHQERGEVDPYHDALTALPNRRNAEMFLEKVFAQAQRGAFPLSVVLAAIDHFERFNDPRRRIAGDQAIVAVAQCAQRRFRTGDILARFAGEQFLAVCPGLAAAEALRVGERVRAAVEKETEVTVSVGLASLHPGIAQGPALVAAAEQAMSRAQKCGRNRVEAQTVELA